MGAVEILWKNADKRNGKNPDQIIYLDRFGVSVRSGRPWINLSIDKPYPKLFSRNDFSFCSNTSWWLRMAWGWHLFMVQCWRQGYPDRTFVETRNSFIYSARVFVHGALVTDLAKEDEYSWTYVLNVTSQTWLSDSIMDRPIWWHYAVLIVPKVKYCMTHQ